MQNNYKIYVHITPNGKLYIGQTKTNLNYRWGSNGCRYKGQVFYNAIQKYGWNNIKHILLFEKLSHDEANIIEQELIKKYQTTNSNYGYNIASGGSCGPSAQEIHQYNLSGDYITSFKSVEEAEQILNINHRSIYSSICLNDNSDDNFSTRSAGGFLWSYDKSNKIKSFKDSRKREIHRYDLSGKYIDSFNSATDAKISLSSLNISLSAIYSCLNGDSQSCSGFMWSYEKKNIINAYVPKVIESARIPIYQYNLNGKYIRSYSYVEEAAKKYNVNCESIRNCCANKTFSLCGYMWSYKKQESIKPYKVRIKEKLKSKRMLNVPIHQYDKQNNLINTFTNASVASKETGIGFSGITQCCKGILNSSGGFIWKYAI